MTAADTTEEREPVEAADHSPDGADGHGPDRGADGGSERKLDWLLAKFADEVVGVTHAVTVSSDGILLASSRDLPAERAGQLSAIVAGLVSLTDGASRCLDSGTVRQTVIEMVAGYLFLMSISDGSSLGVLAVRGCDVGKVGYEMTLLLERVPDALVPVSR